MRIAQLILPAFAALALSISVAQADGAGKCTIATKGESPTAKACTEGGQKAAAKQMKSMVKTAKAKGVKFVCDDCHKNIDDYALTDNAKKDFEKLIEASK